ncbi:M23 family metallopeptidase [Nocardioides campestrisoli]|uniref:M23 family metallopeptidase n=1 Tax=Nocardioides campestrisoli TaxID=2736757 RepID=UPI00163DE282|nr:M23 family metallopeptidase [Nocardioides campestrisoli]
MRGAIARGQTWWLRLFVLAVVVTAVVDVPFPWGLLVVAVPFLLFLVRPTQPPSRDPVPVLAPVRGRWVALNSPGSAVPSHGVRSMGQTYAVDLLVPSGEEAPARLGWSLRGRRPASYAAFGRPVHAMAGGTVLRVADGQRDHRARDTWPLLIAMLTVDGFWRELRGAAGLLGNHVVVEHDDGTCAAYAHLRRGSATVAAGARVAAGHQLAEVGNTGNSSEPHLHVQLMDGPRPSGAAGIPMTWSGLELEPALDPRWTGSGVKPGAQPEFPVNGQVFTVAEPRLAGPRTEGPAQAGPAQAGSTQAGSAR